MVIYILVGVVERWNKKMVLGPEARTVSLWPVSHLTIVREYNFWLDRRSRPDDKRQEMAREAFLVLGLGWQLLVPPNKAR